MPTDAMIVRAAIHPAIGVARVGNSREFDGYSIGAEIPGELFKTMGQR